MTPGDMIRELRQRAGWSQERLAQRIGTTNQQVSNLETGKIDLSVRWIRQLTKEFGVSADTLLGLEDAARTGADQEVRGSGTAPTRAAAEPNPNTRRLIEYDVQLSAGYGAVAAEEAAVAEWAVPRAWLPRLQGAQDECVVVEVVGDSMLPDFQPGDRVLVDTANRRPTPPGFFALWDGLGTVIKQVEHIPHSDPPTLRIKSRNPEYESYERLADEVQIAGRVVGLMRRL